MAVPFERPAPQQQDQQQHAGSDASSAVGSLVRGTFVRTRAWLVQVFALVAPGNPALRPTPQASAACTSAHASHQTTSVGPAAADGAHPPLQPERRAQVVRGDLHRELAVVAVSLRWQNVR